MIYYYQQIIIAFTRDNRQNDNYACVHVCYASNAMKFTPKICNS